MTKADDAYKEAERRIAKALAEGATELNLKIEDLETIPPEIADLKSLTGLDLRNTRISDATPLAALTSLTLLVLSNTRISDVTPLATLTSLTRLFLSNTQISDATPLAALTSLTRLDLDNTRISDATPLAALTSLTLLDLDNTQISDLRPIENLESLVSDQDFSGLFFQNTPATELDPELKRLSEIKNHQDRTRQTLDYLKSLKEWPPRKSGTKKPFPKMPEQADVLAVFLTDGDLLEIMAALPDDAEFKDRVKQACHDRLKTAASNLINSAGNHYAYHDLTQRALEFRDRLDQPFEELDMLDLHFGIEMFREVLENRDERSDEDALTPKLISSLSEIDRYGPGLVRDNEHVEAFEKRRAADHDDTPVENQDDKSALLGQIEIADEVMGDNLRDVARQSKDQPAQSKRGYAGTLINRHTIIKAGGAITLGVIGARADALVMWLYTNADLILAVSAPYGESFLNWISPIIDTVRQTGGQSYQAFKALWDKTHGEDDDPMG